MHIFIKMKKSLSQKIKIPEGVEIQIDGNEIVVKGPEGENKKKFNFGKVAVEKKEGEIILKHEKATKREKKTINTITAHIKNMINGVQKKFEYKLKVCSSHFPITVKVEGHKVMIKNFLGEKIERKTKIPEDVDVHIDRDVITINSTNKESAGQAAANFETATRISGRDRRVFQDGIFITSKDGKEI